MPQSSPASFVASRRVFNRAEYAEAAGFSQDDAAVEAMLARHVEAGEIKHVAEDVFGRIPEGDGDPARYPVDRFLAAAWLRPGAVFAYHSALDRHGYAYSATSCLVQAFVPEGAGKMVADGMFYRFYEPAAGIVLGDGPPADGIETFVYRDTELRRTTLERTVADIFDRPELYGDTLVESLDYIKGVDGAALARHLRTLGNAAAAGAAGFWLESRRGDAWAGDSVDDATLEGLRALAPREPRYALAAEPEDGMLVEGWNVVLPDRLVASEF